MFASHGLCVAELVASIINLDQVRRIMLIDLDKFVRRA
jgi:hypothetical protein